MLRKYLAAFLLIAGMGGQSYAQPPATKAQTATQITNTIYANGRNGIGAPILQSDLLQMLSVSASWQGSWSSIVQYSYGEVVSYANQFWVGDAPFIGTAPGVTAGQWTLLSSATGPSNFAATYPLTVAFASGVTTYALNYDSNFSNNGSNQLAFASIASGDLLANSTSGLTEPTATTATALLDRAFGSTAGEVLQRGASAWGIVGPLTGYLYGNGGSALTASTTIPTTALSGTLQAAQFPALTGDVTTTAGSLATTVGKIGGNSVSLGGSLSTGGAFSMSGAYSFTGTLTGNTSVTFPTSGTLATTAGANVASVSNSNSSLTVSPTTGNVVASINTGHGNTWTGTQTFPSNSITNAELANSTISGIALGANLDALTFGTHLAAGGTSYNGSAATTITSDATNANTASAIVARDSSGNFSAGTITASLTGHASLDLALTGGTMSGSIAMGGANVTGILGLGVGSGGTETFANLSTAGAVCNSSAGLLSTSTGICSGQSSTGTGGFVLASSPSIASPTVTSSFTATGLVTNADLASLSASSLLGNPTGSSASPEGITLGSTLNFSGTALNATTATTSQLGVVKPDGTTITIAAGVITAVGGVATTIDAGGATSISNGTNGGLIVDVGGVVSKSAAITSGDFILGGGTGAPTDGGTISSYHTAGNGISLSGTTNVTIAVALSKITNSLASDVTLNTSTYTDGPSVAQGTTGTWFASGTVTFELTSGATLVNCKLWDGTTVIASASGTTDGALFTGNIPLSGYLASPAANIRISCITNTASTLLKYNYTGTSKDSTLTAIRIQ